MPRVSATIGSVVAVSVMGWAGPTVGATAGPTDITPTVTVTDLGTSGYPDSVAADVNSYGKVIGNSTDPTLGISQPTAWWEADAAPLADSGFALQANDRDQVIGSTANGTTAMFWDRRQGSEAALRAEARFSAAVDLNDRGEVLLWYALEADADIGDGAGGRHHAVVWHEGTETPVLPAASVDHQPPEGATLRPVALNARGEVVVTVEDVNGRPAGAYHWFAGHMTDLGSLGGGGTAAVAIDEHGWIAGTSRTVDGQERAFIWQDGTMRDLGTLGGDGSAVVPKHGAMSNAGHVVGTSTTADGQERAFIWYDGTMHDLGTLGGRNVEPTAVNDRGQVVGHSLAGDGEQRAFFWDGGDITGLGGLGGNLSRAYALNEAGQIVGVSLTDDGRHRATLWTVR